MTTYVLAQLRVHDAERYGRYVRAFLPTLEPFGGRLLVADPRPEVLQGPWPYDKVVIIRFPTRAAADQWAASDAYRDISVDREAATTTTVIRVRAVQGPANEGG